MADPVEEETPFGAGVGAPKAADDADDCTLDCDPKADEGVDGCPLDCAPKPEGGGCWVLDCAPKADVGCC